MRGMLNKLIKIILFAIAVILAVSIILPVTVTKAAEIASGTCGENLTWTLDSEGVLTISGYGYMDDYNGYDFLAPWHDRKNEITIVSFNSRNIKNIGAYAFVACKNLKSVQNISNVSEIGACAFEDCISLSEIVLPEGIDTINAGTFCGCSSITNISIPSKVTSIGHLAFYGCSSLTEISIPDGITILPDMVFATCSSLLSVSLPDSIVEIDSCAFSECSSLESIEIPKNVNSIGDSCFTACYSLKRVSLPEGITIINDNTFSECSSLESISIPENVNKICDFAFSGCSELSEIVIPEKVSDIGEFAFQYCTAINELVIPKNVSVIGETAFNGCLNLMDIRVDSSNPFFNASGGVLFNKDCTNLLCYPAGKTDHIYFIPESVSSIAQYAFFVNEYLQSVTIPDSVTYIGDNAFFGCSMLSDITIPEGINEICEGVFWDCPSITEITIPNSVTEIGPYAFCECTGIKKITIPLNVETIGDFAFSGCSGMQTVFIPENVSSIGAQAFSNCGNLVSIEAATGNNFYSSQDGVLFDKNQTDLACYPPGKQENTYDFPDSVVTLSDYAFAGSRNLTELWIPDSIEHIGEGCFLNCSSLVSVHIPESVNNIEDYTFNACTSLSKIEIPDDVTRIGAASFSCCSSLSTVKLPNCLEIIDTFAFAECVSLKSVIIPDSITEIGGVPFWECNLSNLFFEGSQTQWDKLYKQNNTFSTYDDPYEIVDDKDLYTSEETISALLPKIIIKNIAGGVQVTINSSVGNTYYTIDGSIPCTASIPYEGTFILDEPGEYFINARAFNLDEEQCSPVSSEYINLEQSEKPEIHEKNGLITITGEGDIYYSLDVTEDPTTDSYRYTVPLSFSETTVIKARGIEEGKAASEVAGYTYYAGHASGITFPEESYSFENIKQSFGYTGFAYRIPEKRYTEIFGSSVGEFLYDEYGADAWGGSCFGMSATSILFHKGMLNLNDYSDAADTVYDLLAPSSSDSMLTQLIERYQISQFLPAVMEERGDVSDGGNMVISGLSGNETEAEALLDAVRSGLTGGDPVILIVWRQDLAGSHAVVPYKVEDGKIYVYDCNNPGKERYITYKVNNNGTYSFGFGEYSYAVSYNRFSTLMNGIESSVDIGQAMLSSEEEERMLISIDSTDVTILDMNGNEVDLINYRATEDMETENTVICLEAGSYRIKNNDSSRTSLTLSAANDIDYQKMTVNDGYASIEVRIRNGRIFISASSDDKMEIESFIRSASGSDNHIVLNTDYAEIYSTTDKTAVVWTTAKKAVINGKEQSLINDESNKAYYFGAAVSADSQAGAGLYREGEPYTLSTDITALPGEAFNLTAFATGGNDDTILYVASFSDAGRMISLKGVRMTAGKTRYVFGIGKNASEVKVFMVSADKYRPLINNMVIK